MGGKKVIIKIDDNESCILENSKNQLLQRIDKGSKIFHPIHSSSQNLISKISKDHSINIHLLTVTN